MRFHLTLPVLALLFLSACSGLTTAGTALTGSVSQVAPDAVNTAKKLLTAAHEAIGLHGGLPYYRGHFEPVSCNLLSQAKGYLDASEAALTAADTAIKLGDAVGVEAKIATATTLIAQAEALVGKN